MESATFYLNRALEKESSLKGAFFWKSLWKYTVEEI